MVLILPRVGILPMLQESRDERFGVAKKVAAEVGELPGWRVPHSGKAVAQLRISRMDNPPTTP